MKSFTKIALSGLLASICSLTAAAQQDTEEYSQSFGSTVVLKCAAYPVGQTPPTINYQTPTCSPRKPAAYYNIYFKVFAPAGSYTYSWTIPAIPASSIYIGCDSVSDSCDINNSVGVGWGGWSKTIQVGVTGTSTSTASATVNIPAVCYAGSAPQWC
jgi:hypothetical protein